MFRTFPSPEIKLTMCRDIIDFFTSSIGDQGISEKKDKIPNILIAIGVIT